MKKQVVFWIPILLCLSPLLALFFREKPPDKIPVEQVTVSEWDKFVEALILVESGGNPYAVGSSNDVGILQITPIYVREVNRIIGKKAFTLDSRTNPDASMAMFEIYQWYYNPNKDIDLAIRLHNPGAGKEYRSKIISLMKTL